MRGSGPRCFCVRRNLCRLVPILDPGDVREQAYVLVVGADIGVSPEPGVSLGCEQEFSLVGDDGDAFGGECVFIREFFPARGAEVEPLGGVYVYGRFGASRLRPG